MNSLTTVGGTVVDADEMDVIDQTKSRRRTNVVRRVRSVDDQHHHRGNEVDTIDMPLRAGAFPNKRGAGAAASANLPPAALGRQRSAPLSRTRATATLDNKNDGLDLRPPRPEYSDSAAPGPGSTARSLRRLSSPRSSPSNSARVRTKTASSPVSESREPPGTTTATGIGGPSSASKDDSSGGISRAVTFETTPTPAPLSSPKAVLSPAALATKRSILTTLHTVSGSESYANSPYFQRIFSQGMTNVERYDRELRGVEEALRTCFDVNKDMVHVIASAAAEQERKNGRYVGSDHSMIGDGGRMAEPRRDASRSPRATTKPWEEPRSQGLDEEGMIGRTSMATPTHHQQHRPWSEPRNGNRNVVFSTPTDLSGYTRENTVASGPGKGVVSGSTPQSQYQNTEYYGVGGLKTPLPSNPKHAILSAPSLPATPGKLHYQRSPSLDQTNAAMRPHYLEHSHPPGGLAAAAASRTLTPQEAQEEQKVLFRKEKARQRVQQYLTQIDDRIRHVKYQGRHSHEGSMVKRVRSHDPLIGHGGASAHPREFQQPQGRPWDSSDAGMRTGGTRVSSAPVQHGAVHKEASENERSQPMTQRLLLPSLETPGGGWEQRAQQQQQSQHQQQSQQTLSSSGARVAEASRPMTQMVGSSLPLDESDIVIPGNSGEVTGHSSNGPRPTVLVPPYDTYLPGSTNANSFINAPREEHIRAVEKSVGLKSIQDYKDLLKQKTLEVQRLEHKFQTQMERNEQETEAQEDEICQFKVALSEAERAIKALEDTIHHLEEASHEKDGLIQQLQTRVQVLELALAKSGNSNHQKEMEHQEHVRLLSQRISEMGVAIKEKDGSLSSLRTKTQKFEAELATTLAAMSDAQHVTAKQSQQLQTSEQELASTKELLNGQANLYKKEISSSLENTTQLMGLVAKEKDNLIDSLNAKICVLEQSLQEVEEEADQGALLGKEKEEESKDKSRALKEKDRRIAALQKETAALNKIAASQNETEKSNKKTQTPTLSKTHNAKTQTPIRKERKKTGGRREDDDDAKTAGKTSSRRRRSHSRQRTAEKQQATSRHSASRHQNQYPPRHQRVKKEPPAALAPGYYDSQQQTTAAQGTSMYDDDARDDEVVYHDGSRIDDGGRHGHSIAYYTSKSSDGDSVFDFSS